MSARFPAAVVTAVLATTSSLAAQQPSLVNLAAQEARRRQAVTQASKIYTNADVKAAESNPDPIAALPETPSVSRPPIKSDHDLIRERGEDEFEQAALALARQADDLDTYRQRYRIACTGGSYAGLMLVNSRYVLVSISNAGFPECLLLQSEIASLSKSIRTGMEQAVEDARRADVYPGTVRDIRKKYALDGSDWAR